MLPLYNPRTPSFLTVWINTSMGPFCVLRSAPYREKAREGVQTYPLRWNAAYSQPLPRHQIRLTLTRSGLCSRLYGIKRLPREDLCSTSDAPSNEFVDCSEICHSSREKMASEEKEGDSDKLVRRQLAITRLARMASTSLALIDNSHPPRGLRLFPLDFFHALSVEAIL